MKHWKILLCTVLAGALLVGCSGGLFPAGNGTLPAAPAEDGVPAVTVSQGPFTIGVLQYAEHASFDMAREAFMSRLEEWGYSEEQVEIDYRNAKGDRKKAESICQSFVGKGKDMIVALSDEAARLAIDAAAGSSTKVVFIGVRDARTAQTAGVTGTGDGSSATEVLDLMLRVDPALKTLGLLYDGTEQAAQDTAVKFKAYCAERGVAVEEAAVTKSEEISAKAKELCEKTDALFTPAEGMIERAAAKLSQTAKENKKPWYTDSSALTQKGALAAVCADYEQMGRTGADMAVEIMSGKAMAQVPSMTLPGGQVYLNQTVLDTLPVIVPEDVSDSAYFFTTSKKG